MKNIGPNKNSAFFFMAEARCWFDSRSYIDNIKQELESASQNKKTLAEFRKISFSAMETVLRFGLVTQFCPKN